MKNFRMNIIPAIATGIALSLFGMHASAQVIVQENGFIPEIWDGAYFGAYFGGGNGDFRTTYTRRTDFTSVSTSVAGTTTSVSPTQTSGTLNDGNAAGSIAELFIGYNFHPCCSLLLFGGQLEGTFFSNIYTTAVGVERGTSSTTTTSVPTTGPVTVTTTSSEFSNSDERVDRLGATFTGTLRAGYLAIPNLLLYVLGGAVGGNFVLPDNGSSSGTKTSIWKLGYTAGAGLEYRFNNNWSIMGEYRYLHFQYDRNYNSFNNTTSVTSAVTIVQNSTSSTHSTSTLNFNIGKVGIVYRFDPVVVS